ncbi:protein serine/threonine kinase, putative [Entamoeba invadens IP1]|uniref:Protein serine/threonine kinase, putative n=1 Tax=Entamoeba invadens IP1 TaxID=370355 RepID=L7FLW1_ENTIV|nr:protein serine/threonine kinase, putative [Entamoeba invadens IP1]ELP89685.1 protein serine/threonine kinase, putative [Entamoeba invadens IP1]|eukprot:XP_004256456.1 protein serine/threonine kinase, putative [Entamoeba invadens IP1]
MLLSNGKLLRFCNNELNEEIHCYLNSTNYLDDFSKKVDVYSFTYPHCPCFGNNCYIHFESSLSTYTTIGNNKIDATLIGSHLKLDFSVAPIKQSTQLNIKRTTETIQTVRGTIESLKFDEIQFDFVLAEGVTIEKTNSGESTSKITFLNAKGNNIFDIEWNSTSMRCTFFTLNYEYIFFNGSFVIGDNLIDITTSAAITILTQVPIITTMEETDQCYRLNYSTSPAVFRQCVGMCNTCQEEYNPDGECFVPSVVQKPNCISCYVDETSNKLCNLCKTGFYLENGDCVPCVANCASCDKVTGICFECAKDFELRNNTCVQCINTNCEYCNETNVCVNCKDGYTLNTFGECVFCKTYFGGCEKCSTNEFKCNQCTSGNYLKDGGCASCTNEYCLSCGPIEFNCSRCIPGYFPTQNREKCITCNEKINCSICSTTSDVCVECNTGYYPHNSQCASCASINCEECDSENGICSRCMNGYGLDNGNCIQCETTLHCLNCVVNGICEGACELNYTNHNGICQLCSSIPNCKTCLQDRFECTECLNNNFLIDGICEPCAVNNKCSTCSSTSDHCEICKDGNYPLNYKCVSCSKNTHNCLTCSTSNDTCITCKDGHYMNKDLYCDTCRSIYCLDTLCSQNGECSGCLSGYYLDGSTCMSCELIDGCAACSPYSKSCVICKDDYYKKESLCHPCTDLFCDKCDQNGYCSRCLPNYYLDNGICVACLLKEGCAICSNTANACLECLEGYFPSNEKCLTCSTKNCESCDRITKKCFSCVDGYYLNTSECILCSKTNENCNLCNTWDTCLLCNNNYFLEGNKCISCSQKEHCSTCSNVDSKCIICVDGYFPKNGSCETCAMNGCFDCSTTSGACTSCREGEYLNNRTCAKCELNCKKCNSKIGCTECLESFYLMDGICFPCSLKDSCGKCSTTTNSCLTCNTGFFPHDAVCLLCSTKNCSSCDNSTGYCTSCEQTRYLDAGECKMCISTLLNCETCSVGTKCLSCALNYFLDLGRCFPCSSKLHCSTCSQTSPLCLECEEDYYPAGKKCDTCLSKHCTVCSNTTGKCSACASGYKLQADSCVSCASSNCLNCDVDINSCSVCEPNYSPTTNGTCTPCNSTYSSCATNLCSQTEPQKCLECRDNYFLIDSECCSCAYNHCGVCDKVTGDCLTCESGYYRVGTHCYICDSQNGNNCSINGCSSVDENVCFGCAPHFFLSSQRCVVCELSPNLCAPQMCTETGLCTDCPEGRYLFNGVCLSCNDSNILHCNNNSCQTKGNICLQCQMGYYLFNGYCKNCTSTNPNFCDEGQCDPEHEGKCLSCKDNYLMTKTNECRQVQDIILHCEKAVSWQECILCERGYVLNAGSCVEKRCDEQNAVSLDTVCANLCFNCVSAKADCSVTHSLANCAKQFVTNDLSKCLLCELNNSITGIFNCSETIISGCLTNYQDTCYQTLNGYYLTPYNEASRCGNDATVCLFDYSTSLEEKYECRENFYLSYNNTCTQKDVATKCLKYESGLFGNKRCETCSPTTFIHKSECVSCLPFCEVCDVNSCFKCLKNYVLINKKCYTKEQTHCTYIDDTTNKCILCNTGYYLNDDSVCEINDNFCLLQWSLGCIRCITNMTEPYMCVVYSHTKQRVAKDSYIMKYNSSSVDYRDSCLHLSSVGCLRCRDGYYPNGVLCVTCPESCTKCSTANLCTVCVEGFYISNGLCVTSEVLKRSCKTPFLNGIGCRECKETFYRNGTSCYSCDETCQTCTDAFTCTICVDHFFKTEHVGVCRSYNVLTHCLNKTVNGCTQCEIGYFMYNGECYKCHQLCRTCTSSSLVENSDHIVTTTSSEHTTIIINNKTFFLLNKCTSCHVDYVKTTNTPEFVCVSYSSIKNCASASSSVCKKCSGYYQLTDDKLSCQRRSLLAVVFPIVLVTLLIVLLLISILLIVLITKHFDRRETLTCRTKFVRKIKDTRPQLDFPLKCVCSTKSSLTFSNLIPVGVESEDVVTIGNVSHHTLKLQFVVKDDEHNEKYHFRVDPPFVTLRKGYCCEFHIYLKPMCTCRVVEDIVFLCLNLSKGIQTKESLTLDFETELSSKLDPDDLFIKREIGRGGAGVIYYGMYRKSRVAVKKVRNVFDVNSTSEFMCEIAMLEKMRNDYIIHFYGAVIIPNKLCLVTEYAAYGSLGTIRRETTKEKNGTFAIKVMLDAVKGLDYLHTNSIIHRDFKPDNILIVSLEIFDKVNAKLSDFGTARNLNCLVDNLTFTKGIGTPVYMAPEILRREDYNSAADIYAVAISLFEVFCWEDPFPKNAFAFPWSIARAITSGIRPQYTDNINENQKSLTDWCWTDIPSQRPRAEQVCERLETMLQLL